VHKVRVVVANRPRLMRDAVIATLSGHPDIEIVGEIEDEAKITDMVDRVRPDFLIVALEEPEVRPGICGFLLGRYPQMKVLAVAPEKNVTICYWAFCDLRSKRYQTSEETLLGILRSTTPVINSPLAQSEADKCVN
jgi:hypothetical protein